MQPRTSHFFVCFTFLEIQHPHNYLQNALKQGPQCSQWRDKDDEHFRSLIRAVLANIQCVYVYVFFFLPHCFLFFLLLRYYWHTCKFKVYDMTMWYTYMLWNDHSFGIFWFLLRNVSSAVCRLSSDSVSDLISVMLQRWRNHSQDAEDCICF